jgi:hypothetical protein
MSACQPAPHAHIVGKGHAHLGQPASPSGSTIRRIYFSIAWITSAHSSMQSIDNFLASSFISILYRNIFGMVDNE